MVMNNPFVQYHIQCYNLHQANRCPQTVIAPVQHHIIPPIHKYPSEDYISQQSQRMTSTSEEEETQNNSKNEWQVIRRTRRKKIHRTQHNTLETKIKTHNRYGLLTNETNEDSFTENQVQRKSVNHLHYSYMVL